MALHGHCRSPIMGQPDRDRARDRARDRFRDKDRTKDRIRATTKDKYRRCCW